jgi:hypothetical protein
MLKPRNDLNSSSDKQPDVIELLDDPTPDNTQTNSTMGELNYPPDPEAASDVTNGLSQMEQAMLSGELAGIEPDPIQEPYQFDPFTVNAYNHNGNGSAMGLNGVTNFSQESRSLNQLDFRTDQRQATSHLHNDTWYNIIAPRPVYSSNDPDIAEIVRLIKMKPFGRSPPLFASDFYQPGLPGTCLTLIETSLLLVSSISLYNGLIRSY